MRISYCSSDVCSSDLVLVNDWLFSGLEDDIRPHMFAAADEGLSFALATIVAADGGPRPVGAQMVVTETDSWGFLSGGCIESDVARNGREVIRDGRVRALVYGTGDQKSTRLHSSHYCASRMPFSAL